MDGNIFAYEQFYPEEPQQNIVGYQCSADGKHFAEFPEKRCRYCRPIPKQYASCQCGWKGNPEERRVQWGRRSYCPICGCEAPIRESI